MELKTVLRIIVNTKPIIHLEYPLSSNSKWLIDIEDSEFRVERLQVKKGGEKN